MKKIISMAICLMMVLSLVQLPAMAADNTTITSQTEWDTYISSVSKKIPATDTIYLQCDITVTSAITQLEGKIIGQKDGVADAPVNVTINYDGPFVTTMYGGAEIHNLVLNKGNDITQITKNGAPLVALIRYGTGTAVISNVENNVLVTTNATGASTGTAAGIVGCIRGVNTTISNCTNKANITSSQKYAAGGIVGYIYNESCAVDISKCINAGIINALGTDATNVAGGIIGGYNYTTTVTNCANKGSVSAKSTAGGIVGGAQKVANLVSTTISGCYNEGSVSSDTFVGGISGSLQTLTTPFSIENCYNKGIISTSAKYAAGIIPYLSISTTNNQQIINCYNTGAVTATNTAAGICAVYQGDVDFSNNYSLYSASEDASLITSGTELLAEGEFGWEKVNDLGSAYISMQGSYPVLRNNLPLNNDLTPISTYKVTLTHDDVNGTASKDRETLVVAGTNYSVDVVPNSGYEIDTYSDNLSLNDKTFTTTTAVNADTEIEITYKASASLGGITSNQDYLYNVYEDTDYGFNLLCFARLISTDNLTSFGIQLLDENKEIIHEGDAMNKQGHYNGQFGVRFFGKGLDINNTYYLRPYVQYGEDAIIYGDDIEYTPANN